MSFLGIGLPSTFVSWGGDISDAQASLRVNPAVLFYPTGALGLTVLSFSSEGKDLVANVRAGNAWAHDFELRKIGKPADREARREGMDAAPRRGRITIGERT